MPGVVFSTWVLRLACGRVSPLLRLSRRPKADLVVFLVLAELPTAWDKFL